MGRKYVMQEDEDLFEDRMYFNKHIAFLDNHKFKEVEDIDLENLREFLTVTLHAFQEEKIDILGVLDILDYIRTYLHRRYMDEWPENHYPVPPDIDPLSIGLNAIDFIKEGHIFGDLRQPHIQSLLLHYLQTPLGEEEKATVFMDKFIEDLEIKWREKKEHENLASS